MRKIGIFMLVVLMTCLSSQAFGYLEKIVYCDVEDNNVTIFMKNQEGATKCQVYLDTIYQLALKKYNETLVVRSYIQQGDDVYYWKSILEEKNVELLKLVNYRTQIKTAVQTFEMKLFTNFYVSLEKPMKIYYSDLETQYYILANQSDSLRKSDHDLRLAQLEQQMWNVNHILNAQNLDDIMEVVSSYIYLKNQIEGN